MKMEKEEDSAVEEAQEGVGTQKPMRRQREAKKKQKKEEKMKKKQKKKANGNEWKKQIQRKQGENLQEEDHDPEPVPRSTQTSLGGADLSQGVHQGVQTRPSSRQDMKYTNKESEGGK